MKRRELNSASAAVSDRDHLATMTIGRRDLLRQISAMSAFGIATACNVATPMIVRQIGYLSGNTTATVLPNMQIVRDALRALGYADTSLKLEPAIAENNYDRLPELATGLLQLPVDVLMAEATPAALAAQRATTSVPIVFLMVNDPVEQHMVASLSHPGANVTGVTTLSGAISGKRLELLKAVLPQLQRLAVLWPGANPGQERVLHDTETAARALGVAIEAYGVTSATELDIRLSAVASHLPDALLVLPAMAGYSEKIVDFAVRCRLPHMLSQADKAFAGALMGYGPDYPAQTQRAAALVGKILNGARPADLPVEQPRKFVFSLNLSTARLLNISIPLSVVREATEVTP